MGERHTFTVWTLLVDESGRAWTRPTELRGAVNSLRFRLRRRLGIMPIASDQWHTPEDLQEALDQAVLRMTGGDYCLADLGWPPVVDWAADDWNYQGTMEIDRIYAIVRCENGALT